MNSYNNTNIYNNNVINISILGTTTTTTAADNMPTETILVCVIYEY